MSFFTLLISGILLYLLVWFFRLFSRQRILPHGPIPYPLVGNIPSILTKTHTKLDEMAEKFGSIFTLWFGRTPVVVVNDNFGAEEVFLKNGAKFSDRPNLINKLLTKRLCRLPYMSYCPKFIKKQSACRDSCSVNTQYLNKCIQAEFDEMKLIFESKTSRKDFNPTDILNDLVLKLIARIIYGAPIENANFQEFDLPGNKTIFNIANATNQFRWMRIFQLKKYIKFKEFILHRDDVLQKHFNKRRHTDTEGNQMTIMNEIIRCLTEEKPVEQHADLVEEAEILCSDLFFVSLEKIAAALNWMFLYFITWPEIQQHVYEEIVRNKQCEFMYVEEAEKIPYLQAAVYETLRLSAMTPFSTFHQTNDVVTLKGHKLPKGTWVCVNLHAIHHSPKYWENPYQFDPARFITENNENKLRDVRSMRGFFPFGAGIRKCLGDELSLRILSTLMANIVLNFHFDVSPWHLRPSLSGSSRAILVPHPYHITVTKRT